MTRSCDVWLKLCQEKLGLEPSVLMPFSKHPRQLYAALQSRFQIDEHSLLEIAALAMGGYVKSRNEIFFDGTFLRQFTDPQAAEFHALPVFCDSTMVCFATDDPFNPYFDSPAFLSQFSEKRLLPLYLTRGEFYRLSSDCNISGAKTVVKERTPYDALQDLIFNAIDRYASDIHLHTTPNALEVTLRVDGELFPMASFGGADRKLIPNVLKVHAHLDIALRNTPQDGHLMMAYRGRNFDVRVASIPTIHGEDFVLRLFTAARISKNFVQLGFSEQAAADFRDLLSEESGLVLVTGPTGSGKTTTLYSFLTYLLEEKRQNIVTLEDPVEHTLLGIRQSQLNAVVDYNFAEGLRAVLRQDPDTLMIGEIRDRETAKVVLEAAYTGHLVLSTLHTGDVASSLLRLANFNLDPFLLAQSLKGIISQKLIPKICSSCSGKNGGCNICHFTGYSGRTVLAEYVVFKSRPDLRITHNNFEDCLRDQHWVKPYEALE